MTMNYYNIYIYYNNKMADPSIAFSETILHQINCIQNKLKQEGTETSTLNNLAVLKDGIIDDISVQTGGKRSTS